MYIAPSVVADWALRTCWVAVSLMVLLVHLPFYRIRGFKKSIQVLDSHIGHHVTKYACACILRNMEVTLAGWACLRHSHSILDHMYNVVFRRTQYSDELHNPMSHITYRHTEAHRVHADTAI